MMGYEAHIEDFDGLPGSYDINSNLWFDFLDRVDEIAPNGKAKGSLRSTLVGILQLSISRQQKEAAISHIMQLHGEQGGVRTYYESGWTFPEGHRKNEPYHDPRPFTVFERASHPIGLASITYSLRGNQPVCMLEEVQGIKGQRVRLEEIAERVIGSWQSMYRSQWTFILRNSLGRLGRVRDRYFEKEACNQEIGSGELSVTYHKIVPTRAKLQELWGLKCGKEA
jgi:hypothetical protein